MHKNICASSDNVEYVYLRIDDILCNFFFYGTFERPSLSSAFPNPPRKWRWKDFGHCWLTLYLCYSRLDNYVTYGNQKSFLLADLSLSLYLLCLVIHCIRLQTVLHWLHKRFYWKNVFTLRSVCVQFTLLWWPASILCLKEKSYG